MKYAFRIDLEIPDEAPAAVAEQIFTSFQAVNSELVADCREHFAGLVNVEFSRFRIVKDLGGLVVEDAIDHG
jgi:hypothetical protein